MGRGPDEDEQPLGVDHLGGAVGAVAQGEVLEVLVTAPLDDLGAGADV